MVLGEFGTRMLIPKQPCLVSHAVDSAHTFSELKKLPKELLVSSPFLTEPRSSGNVLWNPLPGRSPWPFFIVQKKGTGLSVSRDPATPGYNVLLVLHRLTPCNTLLREIKIRLPGLAR